MISYQREQQQTIPDSEVIIVGVGGAGANMIDRVALDGMEDAQQLALNTDSRTLSSTVAKNKIQMGTKLTRGLGCGGDPDLGLQAAMEVETEIRDALRGHKMVFVCVGLGGGTGSGAAPLVTRIARELGAFVVVFATMPFSFEGKRRREQSETALNELSVLANALVTFDNGRMGELVLAAQGIHEAFSAADRMISESIRAVTRLVIRPGLINVGLDDLMSSLRATRSRCLFGSGIARGENRSKAALKSALNSPLLDKGRLLKNTQTALVHVCGGSEMTLYEVELLMRDLSKTVPDSAHILFGAAVDDSMGDSLSVTIISSLPEEHVIVNDDDGERTDAATEATMAAAVAIPEPTPRAVVAEIEIEVEEEVEEIEEEPEPEVEAVVEVEEENLQVEEVEEEAHAPEVKIVDEDPVEEAEEPDEDEEEFEEDEPESEEDDDEDQPEENEEDEEPEVVAKEESSGPPRRENRSKPASPQGELLLDGGPRGKFEGEAPNLVDGEDLDIPAFLRKKK
ncbi:MAG: cell division protein FtsZ [Akkermansiaceae bacterium]